MSRKKIMLISHNPFSDSDNMGKTMTNLFSKFRKDELCQLFFHNQMPSFDICENYYTINESLMIKSILKRNIDTGKNLFKSECMKKRIEEEKIIFNHLSIKDKIYQFGRKRTEPIYLLRNILWKMGKWKTPQLFRWLKGQKPDCIFFFAGDYTFLFYIVLFVSNYLHIPIYTYFVDEYYLSKKKKQIIGIDAFLYRKAFKKIVEHSEVNFCISEMMCEKYKQIFDKQFTLLMNPFNGMDIDKKNLGTTLKMCYQGNLSFNRWKNLSILASEIVKLNKEKNKKIEFVIYSAETNKTIIKELTANKDVNFKGKVSPKQIKNIIKESDILVHVEDFGPKYIDIIKYSISTKIPELLTSNRLILAIGPIELESINYLQRNKAALTITSYEDMNSIISKLYDLKTFEPYIDNAMELAYKNHNKLKNYDMLRNYVMGDMYEKNTSN